jgi:hypothetical protein
MRPANHIEGSLRGLVLLIDEAQKMSPGIFCELGLLSGAEMDSRSILPPKAVPVSSLLLAQRESDQSISGEPVLGAFARAQGRI